MHTWSGFWPELFNRSPLKLTIFTSTVSIELLSTIDINPDLKLINNHHSYINLLIPFIIDNMDYRADWTLLTGLGGLIRGCALEYLLQHVWSSRLLHFSLISVILKNLPYIYLE